MDISVDRYRSWLEENVSLSDPFEPSTLRRIVHHILLGRNYRILTERNTKDKLLATYAWLCEIYREAREEHGDRWREGLLEQLQSERDSEEELDLMHWLLGLTRKTAYNLDYRLDDFPTVLTETIEYCTNLFRDMEFEDEMDNTWLLLMAGSATLNIRGSQKSLVGKRIERFIIKSMLGLLNLNEDEDYWVNIGRDVEITRETDAEVRTRRGRVRIEVALISSGNQEVIEDKISRVGRNGVVIYDKVGPMSNIYDSAERNGVKLIQIRNNQPLIELYRHLSPLVDVELHEPPTSPNELRALLDELPDEFFTIDNSSEDE